MKDAARAMAEGLARNYPRARGHVQEEPRDATSPTLDADIARWQQEAAPLKGKKLVSYHPDMVYFAERFGMEPVGTIEIRAGVDPTPAHIEELDRQMMREEKVDFVVRELHYPAGLGRDHRPAHRRELVELPAMVGRRAADARTTSASSTTICAPAQRRADGGT